MPCTQIRRTTQIAAGVIKNGRHSSFQIFPKFDENTQKFWNFKKWPEHHFFGLFKRFLCYSEKLLVGKQTGSPSKLSSNSVKTETIGISSIFLASNDNFRKTWNLLISSSWSLARQGSSRSQKKRGKPWTHIWSLEAECSDGSSDIGAKAT